MRLHQLELEAFGPFAGREHVDFDALNDSGILLVNGPTGSGKTSLLDAVAFALFGDVPGSRRSLRQSLRSHHAPPHARPRVELEFSVGGQHWFIERSPQWEAPKRRGTGTTTRPASVLLRERRDGTWHVVSQRLDEAAELITDILGMRLDQFAQVVLLPQGEFAQFLRAKPEDRRILLERLFDVTRFEEIERWFAERKNTHLRDAELSMASITHHMALAQETVARLGDPDVVTPEWSDDDVADLPEVMRRLLAAIRSGTERRQIESARLTALSRAAERAVESSESIHRHHGKYRDACSHLETWPEERIAGLKERIDHAAEVAGIVRLESRAVAATEEASHATAHRKKLDAELENLLDGRHEVDDAAVTARSEALAAAQNSARSLSERHEQAARRVSAALDAHERLAAARQGVEERTAALHEAQRAQAEAQTRLEGTPDQNDLLTAARGMLARLEEAPARRSAQEKARRRRDDARNTFADAERRVLYLRAARLEDMASELATELLDGSPCPVCGSPSHPAPARTHGDAPTPEIIAAAEEAASQANEAVVNAESSTARADQAWESLVDQVTTMLADLTPHLGDEQPPAAMRLLEDNTWVVNLKDTVIAAQSQHEQRKADVKQAASALVQAQAAQSRALESQAGALAAWEAALDHAHEALRSRDLGVDALTSAMDELARDGFPLPEPPDLPARLAAAAEPEDNVQLQRLGTMDLALHQNDVEAFLSRAAESHKRLVALLARAAQARQDDERSHSQERAARAELEQELLLKGFESMSAAHEVSLAPEELAELRSTWQSAIEMRAAAMTTITDEVTAAAAMTPTPDVARLRARAQVMAELATAAASSASQWETAKTSLEATRTKLADAVRRHLPLAATAHETAELAATFSGTGENTLRMRLTSYVLAAHLETVTAMANHRLDTMSDRRYQLKYTDERTKGTGRSGLGLSVIDAWTGHERDTATLSGGEAFMASLALALGLGDAVRADSGGMELHTLFVDEGFGSLDQDTLEQVMGVLDDLREGGRLVGVVSHVTELRARIPTHIEVIKTSEGSTLRVNVRDGTVVSAPE